jgi:hypothetical protein
MQLQDSVSLIGLRLFGPPMVGIASGVVDGNQSPENGAWLPPLILQKYVQMECYDLGGDLGSTKRFKRISHIHS